MGEVTRESVAADLVAHGTRRDLAVQYADAFVEYQEAMANIRQHGAIVQHPRTANPIENPYLSVRDRALRQLQRMRTVKADWLW